MENIFTAASGAQGQRKRAHTTFVAYPEVLAVENERIRDLRKQKRWLPHRYYDVNIYNLLEADEEDEGDGGGDDEEEEDAEEGDDAEVESSEDRN